jgi:hypothetical protein
MLPASNNVRDSTNQSGADADCAPRGATYCEQFRFKAKRNDAAQGTASFRQLE